MIGNMITILLVLACFGFMQQLLKIFSMEPKDVLEKSAVVMYFECLMSVMAWFFFAFGVLSFVGFYFFSETNLEENAIAILTCYAVCFLGHLVGKMLLMIFGDKLK